MQDALLTLEGEDLRVLVCTAREVSLEAARRHGLAQGSAAALAQALAGTLLLAARDATRVDLQLECNGPLRGLLTDAEPDGSVRGLVRVGDLDVHGVRGGPVVDQGRFDARQVLASPQDEKAGRLSILRAEPGSNEPQRAAFPFAGGDPGGAITFFLRNDRAAGGEMAIEVLLGPDGIAEVAAVLVTPLSDEGDVHTLGKPLRQGRLRDALVHATDAAGLARELLGKKLRLVHEVTPRFACRCSRDRVLHALRTLGSAELRDMAEKDHGAHIACDFCGEQYQLTEAELLALV